MSNNVSKSNIAKNIKKLRQEKGISQDQLSKLADLSLNTIVNIEAGNNPNPTIETLEKIAKVSDIQNKAIKKDQENFVLVDDEQKPTYSLSEVLDKVIIGDCLKVMKKLPAESFDCVFVDPPYFLQLPPKKLLRWTGSVVNGVNDQWDVFKDFDEYDNFTKNYLMEIKRLMKPNATIWIIGTYHNIHRIGKIMLDLGFWILNDVIWFKTNPMPNFLGVRFTNATETLIWAVKDKKVKKYTFNKEVARSFDGGKLGINVWKIPICSGKERLKNEKGEKIHSTQKPEELLRRVILTSTKEGDIVFDPMAGTGTTGFVAKQLNRRFVMIEINKDYVNAIVKRFNLKFNSLF